MRKICYVKTHKIPIQPHTGMIIYRSLFVLKKAVLLKLLVQLGHLTAIICAV
jgi:hypothetical protein